jgi:hypothetical protein
MLAKRPPPKIVNLLEVFIGTFEEWDIFSQPLPRFVVRNVIDDVLRLHRVEEIDVMLKGVYIQDKHRVTSAFLKATIPPLGKAAPHG